MKTKQISITLAKVLLEDIGIVSPNSSYLDRKAARLLISPRFWGSKVTVRELKYVYLNICSQKLKSIE